jgi:hypothetical protein
MNPGIYRRTVCALLAAALALALLHAPSMMFGSAVAAGIDCHGSNANNLYAHGSHGHQALDEDQGPEKAPDNLNLAPNCPLAHLTGIVAGISELATQVRGTPIKQAEPSALIAAPPELVDPPPRSIS